MPADEARTTADEPRTTADEARTTADDVRTAVDGVRAAADEARTTADDVRTAVDEFAARIEALADPAPGGAPGPSVTVPVTLSPAAARALVEALRSYHDPRDHGSCAQCGTGRLDETFTCTSCGQPAGLFGQLVRERLARHRTDQPRG